MRDLCLLYKQQIELKAENVSRVVTYLWIHIILLLELKEKNNEPQWNTINYKSNDKSIGTQKELFLTIIRTPDTGQGYNRLATLGPFLLPPVPQPHLAPLLPLTQTPRSGLPDCMSNMMGST